jgi:hypothetical protein
MTQVGEIKMQVVFTVDPKANHVDSFAALAAADEVFTNEVCGKCGHTHTTYVVRNVNGDKYYEKQCMNPSCRAKKPFSLHKEGGTMYFQKKKKGTEEYWGNNGWRVWNKETGQEE